MQDKKAFELWPFVIKTVLVLLTLLFLYFEIFEKHKIPELMSRYRLSLESHPGLYFLLFLLMLVNWGLETMKWRYLMLNKNAISFGRAFQAVWTGVAVSLFTPNRVGEFGGRMLFFEPQDRVKAVSATLAGSVAQFTVTTVLGIVGASFYLLFADNPIFYAEAWILLISVPVLLMVLYLYFRLSSLAHWIEKRKWHKKISEAAKILADFTNEQLFVNLWFSALRYLVFAFQMGIVLYVLVDFQGGFHFWQISYTVFTYFLIQTSVPSIALSEIGVRGMALSVLLLHIVGESEVAALILAGSLLWFLNIILPAIFGAGFIYRTKIKFKKS
jgi:hypothetical protein